MPVKPVSPTEEKVTQPEPQEPVYEDIDTGTYEFPSEQIKQAEILQAQSPEALCSITTDFYTRQGSRVLVTLRGPHPKYVIEVLTDTVLALETNLGIKLIPGTSTTKAPANLPDRTEIPTLSQEEIRRNVIDKGTSPLNKIDIDMDGKILFSVGKFKFDFKDSRTPDTVVKVFDEDLGFTAEHLTKKGTRYTPDAWSPDNLMADWEIVEKPNAQDPSKPKRYYNVTRIHKA